LDYFPNSEFLTVLQLYDIFLTNSYGGGEIMKISARNVLKGKIKTVKHGSVNSEITIALPGGIQVVSIITKKSAQNMRLSKGKEVYAVIKASNVMVATD
jgi:molybdopterin-binding protein